MDKPNETLPPAAMLTAARRVEELAGLLAMLRPMCKRAGKLTPTEQRTFEDVVHNAWQLMLELSTGLREARWPQLRHPNAIAKSAP